MIRGAVLVVSKNSFVRQGLVQALTKDTLSLVGEVCSPEVALSFIQSSRQHVDVIVFDVDAVDSVAGLKPITEQYPEICIVILADASNSIAHKQAAEVKAKALLPNSLSAEALNLTLQLVILGEDLVLATGRHSGTAKTPALSSKPAEASADLSPRETEILRFIRTGAPNKVIARELDVAEATIKVHVKSLMRKLEVDNRTQAAIWAMHHVIEDSNVRAA